MNSFAKLGKGVSHFLCWFGDQDLNWIYLIVKKIKFWLEFDINKLNYQTAQFFYKSNLWTNFIHINKLKATFWENELWDTIINDLVFNDVFYINILYKIFFVIFKIKWNLTWLPDFPTSLLLNLPSQIRVMS